jgi:DNA recombination protein RmuC
MRDFLILAIGLATGGVIFWFIATQRSRGRMLQESGNLKSHISAAEATIAELRSQLSESQAETSVLRTSLTNESQSRVASEARLEASLKNIEEQKKLLADAEVKLKDTFTALSSQALQTNNVEFVKQAEEKMKPLKDALERYETQLKEMDTKSTTAFASVKQLVETVGKASDGLTQQTAKLVTALRAPHVRGRWGEITLQRVVEIAGMSPHCDFFLQPATDGENGVKRPDLLVRLPLERSLVVDAKTPLTAYLDAIEATDEASRYECLGRHAAAVRGHMRSLSRKEYWGQFTPSPDFVVMFIPGESFFSAALEQDRELIEDGYKNRIILATPSTLLALLRTVAHCWQQRDVAENAERIATAGRELHERVSKFAEHFNKIADGLRKATEAFNASVGSWQSRVLPSGRRMAELGVVREDDQLPTLDPVDSVPVVPDIASA